MDVSILPSVNATLNGIAGVFLLLGFYFIRKKEIQKHRVMMITAFSISVLFLVSYLTYHFNTELVTKFQGEGFIRIVYFTILISHSILAAFVPFLAIITLFRGLKMDVEKHRKIARWTFPMWLYVSVTGVVVYLMLYQM
ncbi:MAG: hypothetical protein CL946_13085 [Ectothiorhodospiraceae bacterium]|nr:hypothetical protein [Ectothiorhodospiraceae bacterium]